MNQEKLQNAIMRMSSHSDIFIAIFIVAVIGLTVLPLPTAMVDSLIAVNLATSVALLMISFYIPTALSLSSFPTLLLFTTLFRLALNISTTRQILLNADAGKIIDTFGNLVVGGNLIVGSVIFLIITLVQFLVIAKGSERVAEVGARFTLDAMPGKQMSIDADMRAGTIDMETARERRSQLERESQLYGAMDGAMKFVKNDSIAGLLVTAVNILGGMAVGILQKDMTAYAALETFSILTIGDGLISQVPALFISITAGVIVTRVGSGGSNHLGSEITGQVLGQPKALAVGGAVMLGFVLVPGFPKIQFLVLGTVIGGVGFLLHRKQQKEQQSGDSKTAFSTASEDEPVPTPAQALVLELSSELREAPELAKLEEVLNGVRITIYNDLGVLIPAMSVRFRNGGDPSSYQILRYDTPLDSGTWHLDRLLVEGPAAELEMLGIAHEPAGRLQRVTSEHRQALLDAGLSFLEPLPALAFELHEKVAANASEFLGIQETRQLLDGMEEQYSVLVKEVLRVLPLSKVTDVLKRLVQEDISIRDLRTILEAIIAWAPKEKDVVLLVEYVRMGLSRYICHKYSGGQGLLAGYLFDPAVEDVVRKSIRQTGGGSYLALDPNTSRKLIGSIREKVGDVKDAADRPVLISSMDIRRYIKKLVEAELDGLPVLSFQELGSQVTVQPLARISLAS